MAVQDVKQAMTVPTSAVVAPEWFRNFAAQNYTPLAQEANLLKAAFQAYQLPVAGAAGLLAVVLTTPFPDAKYSPLVTPSWATTCFVSAISPAGFTITFGTAAPGGGGTLYVLAVH